MNDYISDFESIVTSIYGVYQNSKAGYRLLIKEITDYQETQLNNLRRTNPQSASIEFLDSTPALYCEGNPNLPGANVLYECSQGEYKKRNSEQGINAQFIGNMCIIAIYQYWEDHFRTKIARHLRRKREDVLSDIMGDLRLLRNSIFHHRGIAQREIEDCILLQWFHVGDDIYIDEEKFKEIISQVKSYIHTLRQS
ncbi:hypothetical protein ACFLYR_04660 [Chloroflexota bacterium]